jgi:hypothetical protein
MLTGAVGDAGAMAGVGRGAKPTAKTSGCAAWHDWQPQSYPDVVGLGAEIAAPEATSLIEPPAATDAPD